jgi:hypothetical protein
MNGGAGETSPLFMWEKYMGRPRKVTEGDVEIEILRDGVFYAEDVRADKGDKVIVSADVAEGLKANGLAK